jgi:hypothetical protein
MYRNQPKRPRDIMQLAKFIGDVATGEIELPENENNISYSREKKIAGAKGGNERAKKLTMEQKKQISRKAARKRWGHTEEG